MVLAHRSIVRAATAAQSFRAAPVTRQSVQLLGRRFKSTGGSYEKGYTSSDLPWRVNVLASEKFDTVL
ncbi:hypothetical protein PDIG_12180 [Penicillium digitatum PHI26]|uniref:Uncharacterized protein n=2 Tax=Penicillium digitatum TaxID=36651 RepID=K9GA95_PEND2|nr:hypothetical protein PDIP_38400 [Penicillium digitatum Pd1]EKV15857.1 hypothetical protein PDIP_38400 [Penicillium digitatum Pd1]EKV18047.1 hypothetical protein PDIG_12180 [Penicillium digitatum PHI26]